MRGIRRLVGSHQVLLIRQNIGWERHKHCKTVDKVLQAASSAPHRPGRQPSSPQPASYPAKPRTYAPQPPQTLPTRHMQASPSPSLRPPPPPQTMHCDRGSLVIEQTRATRCSSSANWRMTPLTSATSAAWAALSCRTSRSVLEIRPDGLRKLSSRAPCSRTHLPDLIRRDCRIAVTRNSDRGGLQALCSPLPP